MISSILGYIYFSAVFGATVSFIYFMYRAHKQERNKRHK